MHELVALRGVKIQHVPVIAEGVTLKEIGCDTLEGMLQYANRKSLNNSVAEGVVFKSMDGTKSFKCINNECNCIGKDDIPDHINRDPYQRFQHSSGAGRLRRNASTTTH